MVELLPCPFCGHDRIQHGPMHRFGTCLYCGATGPQSYIDWNTRALSPSPATERLFKDAFVKGWNHHERTDDPLEAVKGAERDWQHYRTLQALSPSPDRLREALRPFARRADEYEASPLPVQTLPDGWTCSVQLGDLRRARAALATPNAQRSE